MAMTSTNHRVLVILNKEEATLALSLTEMLEAEGHTVVGPVASGFEALSVMLHQQVDTMLCDVSLQGPWDGIETARQLQVQHPMPLVYLTGMTNLDTLMSVVDTTPAAYITKPVSVDSLRAAMAVARQPHPTLASTPSTRSTSEAREVILRRGEYIYLKHNHQFVRLGLGDIVVLEADNNSTIVVTAGPRYSLRLSLAAILEQLRYPSLVRVHRSFAVNLLHVTSFNDSESIAHGISVPLGRQYKADFMRHFQAS
ncbi:LytR/AlgR family response regulator transcription factor [Hymenobacter sp. B1770]|uniref:LytR/AlgR family response regulator transcription factor n=1 Tax=Hymenobacter sp. B1770 TaxID=1718788 RepID=UPI003CF569B2